MNYQLLQGDNRAVLDAMPAKSIHAIITSPPYFGLRAYSGDQQVEWPTVEYAPMPGLPSLRIQGCEPGCKHEWTEEYLVRRSNDSGKTTKQLSNRGANGRDIPIPMNTCQLCGGWRGGLGNEPTLEAYIGHLILCLRSWRRVLRDDGCCFVNLGDSYANDGKWGGSSGGKHVAELHGNVGPGRDKRSTGLKAKDLCLAPARFALAAQADGWYVRSRIIWAKGVSFLPDYAGSCMPESVQDRPTKSDEDIYLLTKQPNYFWDNEAVKEKAINQVAWPEVGKSTNDARRLVISGGNTKPMEAKSSRSLRSVWVINPQGWDGAHFAVWPEKLVAPMIKAATSEYGCCAQCGAPWERVVEHRSGDTEASHRPKRTAGMNSATSTLSLSGNGSKEWAKRGGKTAHLGWQATCACNADVIPCTVCDPFNGSGTTGAVACAHNRNYIGIDLSADYIELAHERIREAINDSGRAYIAPVCKVADFVDLPLFGG